MSTLPLPIAAFLAGLVSFLSPCVLPLVPGYVSLISGVGVEELKAQESRLLSKVMANSIGFILGFSVVFIALGAISTEVGQLMARYKSVLAQVAGIVIILFGLHLTGLFKIKALYTDARLHSVKGGSTPWGVCCPCSHKALPAAIPTANSMTTGNQRFMECSPRGTA